MDTLPPVDLMERQQLVGWVVRDEIMLSGLSFSEAARRWPLSLPTLNRIMGGEVVGLRFYRVIEKHLGLPERFLLMILDGDVDAIRELDGLRPSLRDYVLRELTGDEPAPRRQRA